MEVPSPKGGRAHMGKENAVILRYDNDMLNGSYANLEDGSTVFIPKWAVRDDTRVGDIAEDKLLKEGVTVIDIQAYDLSEYPHSEVVELLEQVIVSTAVQVCWIAAEQDGNA